MNTSGPEAVTLLFNGTSFDNTRTLRIHTIAHLYFPQLKCFSISNSHEQLNVIFRQFIFISLHNFFLLQGDFLGKIK